MTTGSSVTLIPPGTGGVRDYASLLGEPLQAPLLELTSTTDTSLLSGEFLLLHFSGYGFQKRGVPLWLVDTIRDLQTRFKGVGVVFHELFASGPPWSSVFWLRGYQKKVARDLLMLCDFWLTNREVSARWLLDHGGQKPHRVLPVFSNVGEPPANDNSHKQPRLVVFGSSWVRVKAYEWADGEIFRCAARKGLEIHDLGPPLQEGPLSQRLQKEGVVVHGKLPAEQVSAILSSATYGALDYPADCASKSGVFAAYCSHGVCPILLTKDYAMYDGLIANEHYAAGFDAVDVSTLDPRAIGKKAREWYEPHRIDAHVAALRSLLAEVRR